MPSYLIHFGSYLVSICTYHELHGGRELTTNQRGLIFQLSLHAFLIRFMKTADLVTFTEETLNGKLHFLCSV